MSDCPNNDAPLTDANPQQLTPISPLLNNDTKSITGEVGTGGGGVFNVNNIVTAAQSYLALNYVANEMFGYETKWFRAVPQQRSKDVIFQEYTLSNVEECPLAIKAVIGSNMPPDSAYNFDLMGLEYQVPFEVQIDKKYWESIAGFGTAPQKRDIVYFVMANKLYEVESCYLLRGFMEQETTWKCNLKKYQPTVSRREKDALKETIDIYTVSVEEIFGQAVKNEVKKLVDDQQMSAFNATSQDKYKSFDTTLNTITTPFEIYGTMIAQSFYDLQTPTWFNAVTYNTTDTISTTSDRSILAWIQPQNVSSNKEYNVTSITSIILDSSVGL